MTDEVRESFQCTECQAGVMHLHHITYFTWLDEELVTVPNFPAWVCDGKASGAKRKVRPPQEKRGGTRPIRD